MNLLENLNQEQLEAVQHKDGPLLIVAGAGTGKTTVIAQRIAYLIEQGRAQPEEILALTFTEKAAGEMADRVNSLLPYGYFDLWISTFHSFGERLLKEHGLAIGLPTDFKLLNEFQQWALVKRNLEKFALDYYRPLGNPTKFIHALLKHFSRAKDENISPAQYLEYADSLKENLDSMLGGGGKRSQKSKIKSQNYSVADATMNKNYLAKDIAAQEAERINEVANAYHIYQRLLLDNNALDFGDLINYCLELFLKRPAILEKYRRQFKYILLDEFQDTNWAQYELIKILAAPNNNLAVVGDDDQSIFRFRGASMSNILQFVKDYPAAKKIILTANYRSRQNILDLSYEFIKQNDPNRLEYRLKNSQSQTSNSKQISNPKAQTKEPQMASLDKRLIAQFGGQGTIEVITGLDLDEEVRLVVEKICELKKQDKTLSWNDFAILVRANDSALDFTAELDRRGLPYIFGASRGLYLKPVILDVVSYFKLLDNYHESAAVWRALNLPIYNFTSAELMDLSHLADKKAWSLFEVLSRSEIFKFSPEFQGKIALFLAQVAKLTALAREKPVSEVFLAVMNQTGYLKYLARTAEIPAADKAAGRPAGQARQKSLEDFNWLNQFLKRVKSFESASSDKSVKAFLAELGLEQEAGEAGALAIDPDAGPEAIKILTVHGAKGLEFQHVFAVNLVDKRFPSVERSEAIELPEPLVKEILPDGDIHLEEERRLFYVAMTRAKAGLYFSWARDYGGARAKRASRFLLELGMVKNQASRTTKHELKTKELESPDRIASPVIHDSLIKIPSYFSYSQLAAYSSCPYQYRFAHVLKIPVMGKEQFSFGKTMHATLEKLFSLIDERRSLKQTDLFGNENPPAVRAKTSFSQGDLKPGEKNSLNPSASSSTSRDGLYQEEKKGGVISFEEILKLYEQCWIDDWYESSQKKEIRKKQGREILKVFYEKYRDHWPAAIYLEKKFNLKIGLPSGGDATPVRSYTIRGTIDRVDRTASGLKLVDYKTGQAKDKLSWDDKEQLFIYQLAAENLFKEPVSGLVFYYLENNSQVEFIGQPADLAKIKSKIIETIEAIGCGEFSPRPGRLCSWCDYNGICEYRQRN